MLRFFVCGIFLIATGCSSRYVTLYNSQSFMCGGPDNPVKEERCFGQFGCSGKLKKTKAERAACGRKMEKVMGRREATSFINGDFWDE